MKGVTTMDIIDYETDFYGWTQQQAQIGVS
jgi:hypothetical protein